MTKEQKPKHQLARNRPSGPQRQADHARQFRKDWNRLSRSGHYSMNRLKGVMRLLIADDGPLGPEYRDHALKGSWAHHRECHIGGDLLLIYRRIDAGGPTDSIYFARVGTHAELFG